MAEICCGIVSENKSSSSGTCAEPGSRVARQRRMEIRRLKFVNGVTHTKAESESEDMRQKKVGASTSSSSRDFDNALENCDEDGVIAVAKSEHERSDTRVNKVTVFQLSLPDVILTQYPKFGVASICGRRREMEDAVALQPSFYLDHFDPTSELHYFGVYDGHGCSHVATKCRERLHELVKKELESFGELSMGWKGAMERSFSRMDKEVIAWNGNVLGANCKCELRSPECDAVGSTAVVSVLTRDKIIVANCGDSRAVLCRNGKAIPLSSDHKPDRPDELDRIQAAGGRVIYWEGARVLGMLAMSRAIGDNYLKQYVTSEPEVTITERTADDECLILASDGLWDVVSNETACGVACTCLRGKAHAPPSMVEEMVGLGDSSSSESLDKACVDASTLLTKLALARHSTDNISVVVVSLRRDTSHIAYNTIALC